MRTPPFQLNDSAFLLLPLLGYSIDHTRGLVQTFTADTEKPDLPDPCIILYVNLDTCTIVDHFREHPNFLMDYADTDDVFPSFRSFVFSVPTEHLDAAIILTNDDTNIANAWVKQSFIDALCASDPTRTPIWLKMQTAAKKYLATPSSAKEALAVVQMLKDLVDPQ